MSVIIPLENGLDIIKSMRTPSGIRTHIFNIQLRLMVSKTTSVIGAFVFLTGFEPITSSFARMCSIQLSYRNMCGKTPLVRLAESRILEIHTNECTHCLAGKSNTLAGLLSILSSTTFTTCSNTSIVIVWFFLTNPFHKFNQLFVFK